MTFIWALLPVIVALLLFTAPAAAFEEGLLEDLESVGILLAIVCILGRCWSILFIGGHKNAQLVTTGPYAFTRNPLYFFSTIGAFGVGLMTESMIIAVGAGVLCYAIFIYVIRREEPFLAKAFGQDYVDYCNRVPRFWPNVIALFRARPGSDTVSFSPRTLRRTFFDALTFVAVFPLIEAIGWLQEQGYVTPLLHLW